MDNVLGVIGFVIFIVCVISLAAAVTWGVVKISPLPQSGAAKQKQPDPEV
jgi:hypothetical protein